MHITVTVVTGTEPPAAGTPVVIEVRDTSLMDVRSVTVDSIRTQVGASTQEDGSDPDALAVAEFEVPQELVVAGSLTVFAHVEVSGTSDLVPGDLLTVQSYPVTASELTVEVVRI